MDKKLAIFSGTASVIFLSVIALSVAARQYGACPLREQLYRKCKTDQFECLNGACITRSRYCNGNRDCSDGSDENFCGQLFGGNSCPTSPRHFKKCPSSNKCIPNEWFCDGSGDCPSRNDERNCVASSAIGNRSNDAAKRNAIRWLLNKTEPSSATRKWGPFAHKSAVALYLSDPEFLSNSSSVRKEITYELSIQLLSRLAKKKIQDVSSSDVASFINAFLVTCTDPRNFHGFNLVEELRARVEAQNYTSPYLLLTLCNAGDIITDSDVKKLTEAFWSNNREIWTGTKAIALMALSCARNQTDSSVNAEMISELTMDLKQHQYRNGTVENLHTTLLVMQALYSAEPDEDPDNFDESKALNYILESQKSDGSFGNFLLTYYALPVLNCNSLVNVSSSHCKAVQRDEDTAVFDLVNNVGPKARIRYSLWFGIGRDLERTLTMRVPAKTSFYGIMEIAAEIDPRYKFGYIVKKRKPYITAISGILDDSESETFWFPYIVKDGKATLLEKSTADFIPENDDHIVMWYRTGCWMESQSAPIRTHRALRNRRKHHSRHHRVSDHPHPTSADNHTSTFYF